MNVDALRHYYRARLLQFLKRPQPAMEAYRLALAHDPDLARAARALAFLLAEQHGYAEAEQWLRDSLRTDPNNADTWFNLGYVLDRLRRPESASEAFREAVRLNRKFDRAWYGLGLALAAQERKDEAVQALEQAARLVPMNGTICYHLGMAYHALRQGDKVRSMVHHLDRFDRHRARQLILDTGREDLAYVVADLHT